MSIGNMKKDQKKSKPDRTALKQHQFKPGQSGNPKGRPKGSRNKLGEAFIQAMHEDFEAHGVGAIETVRSEKPDQYLKVIASILPKELNVNVSEYDDMTDEQLLERIRQLDKITRPFLDPGSIGTASKGSSGTKEATRH